MTPPSIPQANAQGLQIPPTITMPIIDLTHPIHPGMPVYPGDSQPTITPSATIQQDGYLAHRLTLTTHTGTHLDAPAHLIPGGKTLDQFPISHFHGTARVVDCRAVSGEILVCHLGPLALLQQTEFILILTGWDRFWGQERYFSGYPVLSLEAAAWLAQLPIKGIGVDTPSLDPPAATHLPRHHAFLGRERLIIENLAHLDAIPGRACQLSCLPLAITAADGAPARVIAMAAG
jgi:kynurenine formamidase